MEKEHGSFCTIFIQVIQMNSTCWNLQVNFHANLSLFEYIWIHFSPRSIHTNVKNLQITIKISLNKNSPSCPPELCFHHNLIFQGMFVARGKYLLFADADGASKFSDLSKLEKNLTSTKNADNMAVICGSRAHLEQDSIAEVWYYNKPNSLKLGFMFVQILKQWASTNIKSCSPYTVTSLVTG